MAEPVNHWAAFGRAKKVAALVAAIVQDVPGVRSETGETLVGEFLRQQDRKWWLKLARTHGIRPPSQDTIDAVIATFEARAEERPELEPEPDLDELAQEDYEAGEW